MHGQIQGLARCYQTQIETNTGTQLSAISLAVPFAVRYAGFVLTRFTVRPDGRTPFQYLLGTLYVSPLCMFGESVFALIPDHEVRAAKLSNRWISGCWWGRDASSDEHLVGTKFGVLKCRSVRRKPPGEQWSRRETVEARGTKWNFDVGTDTAIPFTPMESRRDEEMPSITAQRETPMVVPPSPPPALPPQPDSDVPETRGQGVHAKALRIRSFWSEIGRTPGCPAFETPGPLPLQPDSDVPETRGQGVHAKALRIRSFWSEIGRTPGCPAFETPGPGKSHTRECKAHQDAWEESRHTARAEEAKRGFDEDTDTRSLNPSFFFSGDIKLKTNSAE